VVADLKTFIFAESQQDKPNSVAVLRALNDHLSSFAHLIPQVDPDSVVVLSLHDALARVHILKDCQRSRADFGSARSSSSSSDPSGLPSGGAFARQFAD
jgi:trans-aconitate methyltransferase